MLRFAIALLVLLTALGIQGVPGLQAQTLLSELPDDPGVQMFAPIPPQALRASATASVPCVPVSVAPSAQSKAAPSTNASRDVTAAPAAPVPCRPPVSPYARFVNSQAITPLSVRQKGLLAVRDIIDPINLATIALSSGVAVGVNAHSAYGPGMRGWGRDAGYSLLQDTQGETIDTFAIASLTHEDPRYHRMPGAPTMPRVWHAIRHTYVTRHDDGRPMPNYSTLLGFPICAELSNLYVPGIGSNAKSTAERVVIGLAANPADDLITEFLPDLASRLHLRIVFVQRVLNRVAIGQNAQ